MKSPRDYARTILKLHRNGQFWSDLSHRGLSAVERLYSRRAAIEAWKSILTDLDLSVRES
jgi:glycosyltransferase involved in cell wall biosynthesis